MSNSEIKYRTSSPELKAAWFAYKSLFGPSDLISVACFTAGWNAAMNFEHQTEAEEEISFDSKQEADLRSRFLRSRFSQRFNK